MMAAGTSGAPAPASHRRERGIAAYATMFGVTEQELPAAFAARVGPVFAEEALQAAGGAARAHPALTGRDRSIAIITALTAQGGTGRLRAHVDLAVRHGLDEDALTALMTRLAVYVGYAHSSLAMESVRTTVASSQLDKP